MHQYNKFLAGLFRLLCSIPTVSLATAAFIVIFDNQLFWQNLSARLGLGSFDHWRLALTLGAVLILLLQAVFTLVSFRLTFKPFLVGLLLIAAGVSYFSDSFGVVIDKSMIHNILETDVREAGELVTWSLLWHLLVYGVFPAGLVTLIPIRYPSWRRGLLLRAGGVVVSLALAVTLLMSDYKGFVLFGRENRDLQVYLNPSYPVYALTKVVKKQYFAHAGEPLQVLAADAVRKQSDQQSVVVLVVGETARAGQLAANGYSRNTTPYTSSRDVINYTDVESCGTSTAISVPCMFSPFGRDSFSSDRAANSENLLDILQRTGVKVVWRDNDSGSKGVAQRVVFEDFSKNKDARFCADGNCYDEVLLDGLDKLIRSTQEDLLIVLHVKGSHGPSYYKRSPAELKVFTPECTQDNIQDCPRESIVNAYDNTIVYTDYLLSKVIDLLQGKPADSALFYLSDHGESLGENSIYLHGLPYPLAPAEQTHVPMMFWGSEAFFANRHLDRASLIDKRNEQYSQDYLFHTMLGLFHVRTGLYRSNLDLFAKGGHLS
jgi:lipid A ethanolaminephosphotransferase